MDGTCINTYSVVMPQGRQNKECAKSAQGRLSRRWHRPCMNSRGRGHSRDTPSAETAVGEKPTREGASGRP